MLFCRIYKSNVDGFSCSQEYQYTIEANHEISVREKSKASAEKPNTTPAIDPESLSTFKISTHGNEQATKEALKLPYERLLPFFF